MPITQINAKNFSLRTELDEYIRSQNIKDAEIIGTKEEMIRLHLSDRTMVYGNKCIITDKPTEIKTFDRPNRGEIKKFGININQ